MASTDTRRHLTSKLSTDVQTEHRSREGGVKGSFETVISYLNLHELKVRFEKAPAKCAPWELLRRYKGTLHV